MSNEGTETAVNENALVGRELEWAINSEQALQKHKSVNGPIIRTRFPPEPNGEWDFFSFHLRYL